MPTGPLNIGARLRSGVQRALVSLGTGFLSHPDNRRLRCGLVEGELSEGEYYRQLLFLVYRILFLFVAEARGALPEPRALCDARAGYDAGASHSLWRELADTMDKLESGHAPRGLPALGACLFGARACRWLVDAHCADVHLIEAIRNLSHIETGGAQQPVEWRAVDFADLSHLYEGLLGLRPQVRLQTGAFVLTAAPGHERRSTGAYYTPPALIECLLDSTLEPVLADACAAPEPEGAILALTVCDPACGTGHFLRAAARRIARRVAALRTPGREPAASEIRGALGEVVARCIYGVDINPLAVELCKASLWLDGLAPGISPAVLNDRILCGDALFGATPALMARGIADDAFTPIDGDDRAVASCLKRRNRRERRGESGPIVPQDTGTAEDRWLLADAWCAAHVWPKRTGGQEAEVITHGAWRRMVRDVSTVSEETRQIVRERAREYSFFHWHLGFPDIFQVAADPAQSDDGTGWTGGFDVVLGNPPYLSVDDAWGRSDARLQLLKRLFGFVHSDKSDLQFYFLARSVQLCSRRAGLVLSRAFLDSYKARNLRGWLARHSRIARLLDFCGHLVFPGVSVSIALLSIALDDTVRAAAVYKARARLPRESLVGRHDDRECFEVFSVPTDAFGEQPWNFAPPELRAILARIDGRHPLLSSFMELGQGMQTGRNAAFTITRADIESWRLPEALYRRRVRNSEIRRFALRPAEHFLLYVEDCPGFTDLPRPVREWLASRRAALEARAAFKRGDCAWWQYSWPLHAARYGREAIVCPYLATDNRFARLPARGSLGLTDTTVIFDSGQAEDMLYILALLNSRVATFRYRFIGKLKGSGVREYFWNGLSRLPIPRIDFGDPEQVAVHERIVALVRARMTERDRAAALILEAQLDAVIASRLFELSDADLARILDELAALRDADIKAYGEYRTRRLILEQL